MNSNLPITKSKSEVAYDWVRERIRTREYEPGHRLVLSTIAENLDMSVVPVREAIRSLEAEGLVTYEHNVGARVTRRNREDYASTMETVAILEAAATASATPHLKEDDLREAESINDDMRELLEEFDPVTFTKLNKRFHRLLFRKCPNPRLIDLIEKEWEELDRHRVSSFRYVPQRASESVDEHSQIIALIRAKASPEYLETVARAHRLRTLEVYLQNADSPQTSSLENTNGNRSEEQQ